MKSLIIKRDNGCKFYNSGWIQDQDGNTIPQTEEQEEQRLYVILIEDVRRQEFDKNLISLIQNFNGADSMKDWSNIQIVISYSNEHHCEMNIGNDDHKVWLNSNEV
jgi:hypothetical protein